MKKTTITTLLLAQSIMLCAQQLHVGALRVLVQPSQTVVVQESKIFAPADKRRVLAATERAVGHTDGDSITTKDAYIGQAGTYRVGAALAAGRLTDYKGCKVVGLRFALAQSVGKTSAYILMWKTVMPTLSLKPPCDALRKDGMRRVSTAVRNT